MAMFGQWPEGSCSIRRNLLFRSFGATSEHVSTSTFFEDVTMKESNAAGPQAFSLQLSAVSSGGLRPQGAPLTLSLTADR